MKTRFFVTLSLLFVVALATSLSASANPLPADPDQGGLMFVENVGQFDPQVRFQAQAANGTLWMTGDGYRLTVWEAALAAPAPAETGDEVGSGTPSSLPEDAIGRSEEVFRLWLPLRQRR